MIRIFLLLVLFQPVLTQVANAGVVVKGTRFIYDESQHSLSVTVKNTEDYPYLIKAEINIGNRWSEVKETSQSTSEFIPTPPLFKIPGNSENKIRIVRLDGDLPDDRESVFTLAISAIPPGYTDSDSVQIAYRSNFKIFFRPDNLIENAQEAYKKLQWENTPVGLKVTNPTPYYITLADLVVNGIKIPNVKMLTPYSSKITNWCKIRSKCEVNWKIINDYGRVSSPLSIVLN